MRDREKRRLIEKRFKIASAVLSLLVICLIAYNQWVNTIAETMDGGPAETVLVGPTAEATPEATAEGTRQPEPTPGPDKSEKEADGPSGAPETMPEATPEPTPTPAPAEGSAVAPEATAEPETTAPGRGDAATPAPQLETTAEPEMTATPEETTAPEATIAPEETATPEATAAPEETATPEATAAPEETATPEATAAPEETVTPEATAAPEETATPEATIAPEETATPEATIAPEETATPEATPKPNLPYPSGWEQSNQPHLRGNLEFAGMIKDLDDQLARQIDQMKALFDIPASARIEYANDNLCDILAVYAALTGQAERFPFGLTAETEAARRQFAQVYWDMTKLGFREYEREDGASYVIEVNGLTYADIAERYGMTEAQMNALASLTTDKMRGAVKDLRNGSILTHLTIDEYNAIRRRIPKDVSGMRRAVLTAALSLEHKVKYFWSGKSDHVGWDIRWGKMRVVEAEGSSMSGTARPMGLDCSGFVEWAFVNAAGDRSASARVGTSTGEQWDKSYPIKWSDAKPGDLVFYRKPDAPTEENNHVGIIVGFDKAGNPQIVHCSSSRNNVVVSGKEEFAYVRRPYIYGD